MNKAEGINLKKEKKGKQNKSKSVKREPNVKSPQKYIK
jgi:hypothetical protein